MWFALDLATLITVFLLIVWLRRYHRWKGTPWQRLQFKQYISARSRRTIMLRVGIAIDPGLEFELKRETWFDRLGKSLGLAEEVQVGRREFDDDCYVICDDLAVRGRLRREAAFTEGLRKLAHYYGDYRFASMVCRNGLLTINLVPVLRTDSVDPTLESLSLLLEPLVDGLPPSQSELVRRDPYLWPALLLAAVSGGLVASGLPNLLRILLTDIPFLVDRAQFWALTVQVASLALFLLLAGTIALLRRSSRAHLVLSQVLVFGGVGAVSSAAVAVHDFNIDADFSNPQFRRGAVVSRDIDEYRGREQILSLTVNNWNGEDGAITVPVPRADPARFQIGDTVTVEQHPGRLGLRWVGRIQEP